MGSSASSPETAEAGTAVHCKRRNPADAGRAGENASEFCPICGSKLASRRCKLVCACGYYMSCSDYS